MTTSASGSAIAVTGLRKSFGDNIALDGIDLTVPEGTVFCMLGPNGAGRTTTVNILSTLVPSDAGTVRVVGYDVATDADGVRRAIGVTGQFSVVDGLLTGQENLGLMADLHHLERGEGRRRTAALLERFDLTEAAGKPAAACSGGMKRKLDLAMGLVGHPRIVFLDEPTAGLDPRSRRTMWAIVHGAGACARSAAGERRVPRPGLGYICVTIAPASTTQVDSLQTSGEGMTRGREWK